MLNIGVKKIVAGIASLLVIGGGSAFASHSITATADEVSAQQLVSELREELTSDFNDKLDKVEAENESKDVQIAELQKQLEEANKKIAESTVKVQDVTVEESDNNYATKPYVDNSISAAKTETKEEVKQEIQQQQDQKEAEKEAEKQRIAAEMEKERNESFAPTLHSDTSENH